MKYLYFLAAISATASLSADYRDGYCDEACQARYLQEQQRQGNYNQGNNNQGFNQNPNQNPNFRNNNQQGYGNNNQPNYGGYGNRPNAGPSPSFVEQHPSQMRGNTQYGGYDNQNNNGNGQARVADDSQVSDKVKDVVAGGWFASGNRKVEFDVANGNVTLRGTVDSVDEKNKIEQDVRKIDGVRNVNNQIVVQASKPGDYSQDRYNTDADRQLNTKIRSKLSGWFSTAYDGVILQTNNGTVILWGTVKNIDDQDKLTTEVKGIDGVRSVQNNTKIQTQ